ncbi:MAG: hypothetical protein MI717_07690 [Spirochaetales bacterium]|nr:hypothetical protein [Spirochaetales bacterium]
MPLHDRTALPLGFLGTVVLLGLLPITLMAGENSVAADIVAPLRDAIYAQTLDERSLRELHRDTLERITQNIQSLQESAHARALAHYYLGRYYQALESPTIMAAYADDLRHGRYLSLRGYYTRRKQAMEAYRMACQESEIVLDMTDDAEAHRLHGEILGQMLFLGTIGDLFAIGTRAKDEVDKALSLAPNATKILIQEASRMAYSPDGFGGDRDGARELYRQALRNSDGDQEDFFNIYCGFAMAAFMEKNDDEALGWFIEASTLYPQNVFAQGMILYLENNKETS